MKHNSILSNWSRSSIECWLRGCVCEGCYYQELDSKCKCKETVIELVKRHGKPPEFEEPTFKEDIIG